MKKILQIFFFLLLTHITFAQSYSVQGQIIDAKSGETIIGANVSLVADSQSVKLNFVSDENGFFSFQNLANNLYQLEISYVAYAPFIQSVEVKGKDVNLGQIKLEEGINLPEIQVTERILNTEIIGDTTQINADAYKVMSDASAKDLLKKMPGIEMTNGVIQAQGEQVKDILVDGLPFFENNPNAAVKNLPAETVAKVQIYEREVEKGQANAPTEDTEKVINIVLKKDKKEGVFGNMYGGYGTDERYQAGGLMNIFKGKRRFTLIGSSNNINNSSFLGGEEKNRGFGSGNSGITRMHSTAINYNGNTFKNLKIYANYAFSGGDRNATKLLSRRFFNNEFEERYEEQTSVNNKWKNHRIGSRIKYELNKRNKFDFRLNQTFSDNENDTSFSGETISEEKTLSQTVSNILQEGRMGSTSSSLKWKHQFAEKGHDITTRIALANDVMQDDNLFLSENIFGEINIDTMLIQQSEIGVNNKLSTSFLTDYTRPVGENGEFSLMYSLRRTLKKNDQETLDFNNQTDKYDLFNQDLSNVFENDYQLQQLVPRYEHRLKNWTYTAMLRLQKVKLINQQFAPEVKDFSQENLRFLPRIDIKYKSKKGKSAKISYSSRTREPSLRQLQNVTDNSNPLQLKIGNPELKQAITHRVRAKWQTANTDKSTSFEWRANYSLIDNYLAKSTRFVREEGVFFDGNELTPGTQLTQYLNLDGNWSVNTTIQYNFPFDLVKSNMSISLRGQMSQKPTIINEALNLSEGKSGRLRLSLSSNISDRIDFFVSSFSSYNEVKNSLRPDRNTNFFRQNTDFRFSCIIGKGFVFRTNMEHVFYGDASEEFDRNYLIWNMNIGKKIFKNQRGEINLAIFDILKQNNSLSRDVTEIYLEDRQTNVLQRYILLSFKYDLRVFE